MNGELQIKARKKNWLPMPGQAVIVAQAVEQPVVDEDDNFSKASVEKYYPRQGYGFLVSDRGERIRFDVNVMDMIGSKAEPKFIKEGGRVGYDVGKTPNGPRVCAMKVY